MSVSLSENVNELFHAVADEWHLTTADLVIVTANMIKTAQLDHFKHIKCFAHFLNLATQRVLQPPSVSGLPGRIR